MRHLAHDCHPTERAGAWICDLSVLAASGTRFAMLMGWRTEMDHRWDDSTWQDRAARGERERFGASRIARDPDVERRDREREAERRRSINQSPWSIGEAFYDQRDSYTRSSSIGKDGYGSGPSIHPEEGSYAYPREPHPPVVLRASHANLYEREAWPWLNYKDPEDDPYFAHLHEHERGGLWQRLKDRVATTLHAGAGPKNAYRSDERIKEDVCDALMYRGDLDATDIDVNVKTAEVTLEGTVSDRRSKRIAEETVEGVQGVRDVHNRLTIRRDEPTDANVAFAMPVASMA